MSGQQTRAGRAMVLAMLAIGVLGFGAMSLCGGFWTLAVAPVLIAPGGAGALMMWLVSLPSLVGGFLLARYCMRRFRKLEAQEAAEEDSL